MRQEGQDDSMPASAVVFRARRLHPRRFCEKLPAVQEIFYAVWLLILSQLSPGPDVAYVFRRALAQGFKAGVTAGAGISTGIILHTALVCTFGASVRTWEGMPLLTGAAGIWLLYLAWKIFPKSSQGDAPAPRREIPTAGTWTVYREALICNLLNPKATLFLSGLFIPALGVHGEAWYPWVLGATAVIGCFAGWCLWAGLLQYPPLHRFYIRRIRAIDALFSVALALFACSLFVR